MFENPFVLQRSEYVRDIGVLQHYVEDMTYAIQLETGASVEQARKYVMGRAKEEMKDPEVLFFQRKENGDREKQRQTLSRYIGDVVRGQKLLAPTFTVYTPPHIKESLLVRYIDANVKARGVAKKAMFKAEMSGDEVIRVIKKIEQTGRKLSNNALSGAHVAPGTPLYNKTAHSTLTSNCRVTAGYGNANNEKFLSGNRHYWSADIVRNNLISITRNTDYEQLAATMAKYQLRCPSVRETMACIEFSARLYWNARHEYADIYRMVNKLNDLQRASFVFTGDLYHLMVCNHDFVHTFIDRLSSRVGVPHPNPREVLDNAMEDHVHLAAQLCPGEMKGKQMHDVAGQVEEAIVAATVKNIEDVLTEYADMIRTFYVTLNVPASVAHFPDSIRRSALTGDTDSTIFTVQDWVIWHGGKLGFSDKDNAVAATMIFLAAQTITHVLAKMSKNFGIEEKRLFQTAMKNEFKFDVFTPTQVAKHYFALIGCQEGNLFAKYKNEIKGVHLKTSKAPKFVMSEATRLMVWIMEELMAEGSISIDYVLKWVADMERGVMESVAKGSYEYFRSTQIREPSGYKNAPEDSPYAHYLMWEEVFAPSYGSVPPPPYMSVKVSTDIKTKTDMVNWLASIEDRELAARMKVYCERTGKKNITTFQLPDQIVASKGIPKEVFDRIGVRKMVVDSCKVFYIILETLGLYELNGKATKLISDYH